MAKPRQLFETKAQRAKRLPVGTWFVWPDTTPRRYKYYQPKVYQVSADHKAVSSDFEDIGVWDLEGGVNSPRAAYDRAIATAQTLNAIHADLDAANAYIKEQLRLSVVSATEKLGELLRRDRRP